MARFRQDVKVSRLKALPLFEDLSRRELVEVARLTDDLEVPDGVVLCKEGSRGDEVFVIIGGEAAVTRHDERLATLRSADFFGEIAVIEPVRRTATVTAVTPLRFFSSVNAPSGRCSTRILQSSARCCAHSRVVWRRCRAIRR